ncbi:MAG: tetratricopeptide repeat protein [Treponema sp.]|jgi:tetratricopeptide (TPR) repeat protein|nr:tetratricopeptide repeat protein [Treponema sp.]
MKTFPPFLPAAAFCLLCVFSCVTKTAEAEEYYALGMAYFDLGKYAEAEKWFVRARNANRTQTASEYNLGRIAFETGRYKEAASYFEKVLKKDPDNVTALKAAAYTCIKLDKKEQAKEYYEKLLRLVPESADDGYNYALVLLALEQAEEAEAVLLVYGSESAGALLLLARARKAQGKVEALDDYRASLEKADDPAVRFEYAEMLEQRELFARALEEYRAVSASTAASKPDANLLGFRIGRVLLKADPSQEAAMASIGEAVEAGFSDREALEDLLALNIGEARKEEIRRLIRLAADR